MKAYFETITGETVPLPSPMSPEQMALVLLTEVTGIRRIDDDTIDEFVRRADLYDTYLGGVGLRDLETGEPVAMTRKIVMETMGENVALWTNAGLIDPNTFDRSIRLARADR